MATVTNDKTMFSDAMLDTPFGAACVKRRGFRMEQDWRKGDQHGVIVSPVITQAMLRGHPQGRLENLLTAIRPLTVKVRGHGWGLPEDDAFVWYGTLDEFRETWEVD
jgi:hypothetical protein